MQMPENCCEKGLEVDGGGGGGYLFVCGLLIRILLLLVRGRSSVLEEDKALMTKAIKTSYRRQFCLEASGLRISQVFIVWRNLNVYC